MEVKELLDKISTAGDVAAAALGYAAGFVADTYYFPGGLPPGTVAAVTAVGVVGIKKACDALINIRRSRGRYEGDADSLRQRAKALHDYMIRRINNTDGMKENRRLEGILPVFEEALEAWNDGIIDDSEFNKYLLSAAKECRKFLSPMVVSRSKAFLSDYMQKK